MKVVTGASSAKWFHGLRHLRQCLAGEVMPSPQRAIIRLGRRGKRETRSSRDICWLAWQGAIRSIQAARLRAEHRSVRDPRQLVVGLGAHPGRVDSCGFRDGSAW